MEKVTDLSIRVLPDGEIEFLANFRNLTRREMELIVLELDVVREHLWRTILDVRENVGGVGGVSWKSDD